MRKVSDDKQNDIISALRRQLTVRQVAEQCNVSKSTVQRIRARRLPDLPPKPAGRKPLLSPANKRHCVRAVTVEKLNTAMEATKWLKNNLDVQVSERTVRRTLNGAGLEAAKKVKRPHLSDKNVKARYEFAKQYKDWTVADWERVIWSDETKINRFCSDGMSWCWKRDGEQLDERHVQGTVKHGGGSIAIWGCMTAAGPGYMCRLDGHLNQDLYLRILEDELQQTIKHYQFDSAKVIFQQDNAPAHTSIAVRKWFAAQEYQVLDWPAQSPDLNPIETLWAIIKRRLNRYERPPSGMNELWERVEEIWNQISPGTCKGLIRSMPSRIKKVLEAKGRWIDE
jgi:transposase